MIDESNAIFHLPRKADYTWMPWATYCDPELAIIGMNEKKAKAAEIDYQVWPEHFGENDRALAEGEASDTPYEYVPSHGQLLSSLKSGAYRRDLYPWQGQDQALCVPDH